MTVQKVFGRISEYKGENSCRIEVLSFKKNGELFSSREEIKTTFPPHGYVFAPNFFDNFDFDIDALIEFTTNNFIPSSKGENHDSVLIDPKKPVKQAGIRVFQLPSSVLFNSHSINQPHLKTFIKDELSHFYVKVNNFIYGPFKSYNQEVIPKHGMLVNKYNQVGEYYVNGGSYILFDPEVVLQPVDCMTQTQLADYFKKQIRNVEWAHDINQLKKALETQGLPALEESRVLRLLANLDLLSLTLNEIKSLANLSQEFNSYYQAALVKANDEIKKEIIEPYLIEKNKLEQSVNSLNANIKRLKKEEDVIASNVEKLQKENTFMFAEKDRLINDIKAHAAVENADIDLKLYTWDEQFFFDQTRPYSNLDEYITLVNDSLRTNENGKSRYANRVVAQFKEFKCFLCDNIHAIIQLAKLSNNCHLVIQQVEPDWLKFEYLYKNGLEYIWRSAHANPGVLHFFVLEDLNLASIECYARPLLDMINGIRHKLPSTGLPWPPNLWIFGVPLQHKGEDFGLPLMKKTFDNWGCFPFNDLISIDATAKSGKFLTPNQLTEHSIILTVDINQYFL